MFLASVVCFTIEISFLSVCNMLELSVNKGLFAESVTPPGRQPGRSRITWLSTFQQDLKKHHLMLPEAADLAQNRRLWRMMSTYGATQSQSCMPEMTTTAT